MASKCHCRRLPVKVIFPTVLPGPTFPWDSTIVQPLDDCEVIVKSKCLLLIFVLPLMAFAQTYKYSVLAEFSNTGTGPEAPNFLIIDSAGNLYATSELGGTHGEGTVFKVSPKGVVTVLYNFGASATDGQQPRGVLTRDKAGNFYGTTFLGGTMSSGTIFKLSPSGKETILYNFPNSGGNLPIGGLTLDPSGNLFGELYYSGQAFELATDGSYSTLYDFSNLMLMGGNLIRNAAGNLFGTDGPILGPAQIFELTPQGQETTLYNFNSDNSDGSEPNSKLAQDAQGNLYGSAPFGGANHWGTLFKYSASGEFSVLYSFCPLDNCVDGGEPYGWLTVDASGNIFGVAYIGSTNGKGAVFQLTPGGVYSVLHGNPADTGNDFGGANLVMDKTGNLYVVSNSGGKNQAGLIYKLTKQ